MSMDRLQEKIRKTKNVAVLDFDIKPDQIPPHILRQEVHFAKAYARFCVELLEGLKGLVPAVRFSFSAFALLGSDGLSALSFVSEQARKMAALSDGIVVWGGETAVAAVRRFAHPGTRLSFAQK